MAGWHIFVGLMMLFIKFSSKKFSAYICDHCRGEKKMRWNCLRCSTLGIRRRTVLLQDENPFDWIRIFRDMRERNDI